MQLLSEFGGFVSGAIAEFDPTASAPASVGIRETVPGLGNKDMVGPRAEPSCIEPGAKANYWLYDASRNVPLVIRSEPIIDGPQTQATLRIGERFEVSEELKTEDVIFLKLADGRGWVFDCKPGVGLMCRRAQDQTINGRWDKGTIYGNLLTWNGGAQVTLQLITPTKFQMLWAGEMYLAALEPDLTLKWSDGDVWVRDVSEEAISGRWDKGSIYGATLTWNSGAKVALEFITPTTIQMIWYGETCMAVLHQDSSLHWSDGDVWRKAEASPEDEEEIIGIDTATCSYCGLRFPLIAEAIDSHSRECSSKSACSSGQLPADVLQRSFDDGLTGVNAEHHDAQKSARLRRERRASVGDLTDISDFVAGTKVRSSQQAQARRKSVGDLATANASLYGAKALSLDAPHKNSGSRQHSRSISDLPDIGGFLQHPNGSRNHTVTADVIGSNSATCKYCGLSFPLDAEAIDAHSKLCSVQTSLSRQCSKRVSAPSRFRPNLSMIAGNAMRRSRSWTR